MNKIFTGYTDLGNNKIYQDDIVERTDYTVYGPPQKENCIVIAKEGHCYAQSLKNKQLYYLSDYEYEIIENILQTETHNKEQSNE